MSASAETNHSHDRREGWVSAIRGGVVGIASTAFVWSSLVGLKVLADPLAGIDATALNILVGAVAGASALLAGQTVLNALTKHIESKQLDAKFIAVHERVLTDAQQVAARLKENARERADVARP